MNWQRLSELTGPIPNLGNARAFQNNLYFAILRREEDPELPALLVLSLRRQDREPVTDWRDVQLLKNEILGPEQEMVQLFPAESRLVDTSNQFWLFGYEGIAFPFGFSARYLSESTTISVTGGGPSVQRPFAPQHRPADLAEREAEVVRAAKLLCTLPDHPTLHNHTYTVPGCCARCSRPDELHPEVSGGQK